MSIERKDTDVAWCAGFFDGEGHVSYHRGYPSDKTNNVSAQLYANVPQRSDNIEVLEEFQRIIGFGKLKGPYKVQNSEFTKHVVMYGKNEVEPLFLILKPYLKARKTLDFQKALMGYWTHNSKATVEDNVRWLKWQSKKAMKNM